MYLSTILSTRTRLMIYSFIVYMNFAVLTPHLTIIFRLKGYNPDFIGILMGLFYSSGILGPLFLSNLLQVSSNLKKMLAMVPLLLAMLLIVIAVNNNFILNGILMFFFGFIFRSLNPTLDTTFVNMLDNPHKHYGMVRTMGTLGFIVASFLIAVFTIINLESMWSIVIVILSVLIISILAAWMLIPSVTSLTTNKDMTNSATFLQILLGLNKIYYLILFLIFCNGIALISIMVYLPLLIKEVFHNTDVTSFGMVGAVSEMLTIYYGNQIVGKLGISNAFLVVLGSSIVRLLILAFTTSIWIVYASQLLHMAGFGLMLSLYIYVINHYLEQTQKSFMMGMLQSFTSLASILASVVGGFILQYFNYRYMFLLLNIFPLVGFICALVFRTKLESLKVKHSS